IRAAAPDVYRTRDGCRLDHLRRQRPRADDGNAVAAEVTRGQPPVGVRAEALQVLVPDALRITQHPLADAPEPAVARSFLRREELLELGLDLGFPEQRRPQAADDFEQQGVGV